MIIRLSPCSSCILIRFLENEIPLPRSLGEVLYHRWFMQNVVAPHGLSGGLRYLGIDLREAARHVDSFESLRYFVLPKLIKKAANGILMSNS